MGAHQDVFRVATDAFPLAGGCADAADYGSYQLYALTAAPLLRGDGDTTAGGAVGWTASRDRTCYEFEIGDGRWPDGERIEAHHYAEALHRLIARRRSPLLPGLLDLVGIARAWQTGERAEGIETRRRILRLRFVKPHRFIPQMMTSLATSPLHPSRPEMTAGPYWFERRTRQSIWLRATPAAEPTAVPRIRFRLVRSPVDNLREYANGELDLTCDTAFPFDEVAKWQGRPELFRGDRPMFMVLRPGESDHPLVAREDLRAALTAAIDREPLAAALSWVPKPIGCISDVCDGRLHRREARQARALLLREGPWPPLRLGFHDFYPNRTVVELLGDQLAPFGVDLRPVREHWNAPRGRCDLYLAIHFSFFDDMFGFYSFEALSGTLRRDRLRFSSYLTALTALQSCPEGRARDQHELTMAHILCSVGSSMPLLRLPQLSLCRDRFGWSGFAPGRAILRVS